MRVKGPIFGILFSGMTLLLTVFSASAFKMPDTGQVQCYDKTGAEISCSGTGQDGEYSINTMNFTDSGDGTVTDNNTGLMWQQQTDDTQYNWYQASGTYDAVYNASSQNYCASLTTGGYSDWRLPTRKEFISIVDYFYAQTGPAIDQTFFPTTKSYNYWSSTTQVGWSDYAWYIGFSYGDAVNGNASYGGYVRCVRGGQVSQTFTDNMNGTVTDNKTGLMWQQGEPGEMTWDDALSYCNSLSLPSPNGYPDWRLPNIKELNSLATDSGYYPAIDTSYFPDIYLSGPIIYWSSSTDASFLNYAWEVPFASGAVGERIKTGTGYVRCVRTQQEGVYNLIIYKAGSGGGTVISNPAGAGCDPDNTTCIGAFSPDTIVTLSAVPDTNGSVFSGWSGDADCSDGQVTLSADTFCTATFDLCSTKPAYVGGTPFDSIAGAYASQSSSGKVIKLLAYNMSGNLDLDLNKNVMLQGGYDCNVVAVIPGSATVIAGILTISGGAVTLDNIIIR